jgi:hypothetical protein
MATAYTSLLGLALPVTGELSGSWGDTVNDAITSLLDTAVAGTTSITADADITLTTTTGVANQSRQAIILWNPASGTTTRNITAPAQSKIYTVINASGGTQSIVFRGAGPTTGVTIVKGESAVVAWNGTDFIKVSNTGGAASFTNVTVSGTTILSGLTASTALALDASKNVVSVTNTGTGNNVLATSPTLVTPALGTPSSATLTNATGLPVSTGISGLGAGVATFLATPSSANLATAVTDETGSGALVFATSPTLVTPALGTPSALVGTNITGTAAGLTAGNVTTNANLTGAITSTGNATLLGSFSSANLAGALTDETGTGSAVFANSPTLVTPALGTPASGVVTNLTGTASININGTVGATTAAAGAFTTLSASGVTTVQAGTVSAPAITTTGDTNTGIFFPAADTIAFAEGGVEAMRIDSAGNVGIGTSSPTRRLEVGILGAFRLQTGSVTMDCTPTAGATDTFVWNTSSNSGYIWSMAGTERARIDSSGNLLVGRTNSSASAAVTGCIIYGGGTADFGQMVFSRGANTVYVSFRNASSGAEVGNIQTDGTTTSYVTSSDYRLKHDIQPMTGALAKVAQLKPVTYKWNADDSESQGFIAHELQEVVPECVTGEKDAVNENGSIKPQGIDTSFLVATLTAALQEAHGLIKDLQARVDALEAK